MLWKLFAFVGVTIPLIGISWRSLRHPGSHGFFRFFAWEIMVCLFLVNVDQWFHDPFSWHQIISWVLLLLSLIPLIWGILLLRHQGKPASQVSRDPALFSFEKTTHLVTKGIYQYIRHPLYSSLLLLAWGIFFKQPSWIGGSLAVVISLLLYLTAVADEKECIQYFGDEYLAYMKRTRRFIPFVI